MLKTFPVTYGMQFFIDLRRKAFVSKYYSVFLSIQLRVFQEQYKVGNVDIKCVPSKNMLQK